VQVIGRLLDAANRLKNYPLSGRVIQQWKNPARRELIVGSYRLMLPCFAERHHRFQRSAYAAARAKAVS
jgi:hypothetical protein